MLLEYLLYCNVQPKMFSCRVLHVGRLSVLMDSDENNLKTISKFKFACFPPEFNSHRGKLFTLCSNILSCSNTIARLNPFLKMLFRFFQFDLSPYSSSPTPSHGIFGSRNWSYGVLLRMSQISTYAFWNLRVT